MAVNRNCANMNKPTKEFGMFGLDFRETKRILNRLLTPYGLKLRTHTNYAKFGDQSEVWLEPTSIPCRQISRLLRARDAAIAHIMNDDPKGALAALTLQRDKPELFDKAKFD